MDNVIFSVVGGNAWHHQWLWRSLRYQLEAQAIQVIEAILPMVATPMTQGRGSGKISAQAAAKAIIDSVNQGRDEVFVGKAKLIPVLARLAPSVARKILRGG